MSPRGIAAVACLVPALMLERVAYYGSRSFLYRWSEMAHATPAQIASMSLATMWLAMFAGFLGAGLAIAIGPRLTAAIGALVSALGLFALAGDVGPGFYVVAFGAGLFRTCLWASLAEIVLRDVELPGVALPANRFASLTILTTLAFGALNFAAMSSNVVARLADRGSLGMMFGSLGIADVFAALLAGGAALAGGFGGKTQAAMSPAGPYRTPDVPAAGSTTMQKSIIGLVILLAISAVAAAAGDIEIRNGETGVGSALLYTINPGTISALTFFACAFWFVAAFDRWSLTPLVLAGGGLAVVGLGVLFYAFGGPIVLVGFGTLLTGVGETLSSPVLYTYLALAVPRKYAPFAIASWSFVVLVTSTILRPLMAIHPLRTPLAVLIALVTIGAGIGLALFAKKIHRAYFDPQPTV